jgi:hypothetical protein
VSPVALGLLCGGETRRVGATLLLAEDVRVDSEHRPGVIAEILRDLMDRRPDSQPGRCGIVP